MRFSIKQLLLLMLHMAIGVVVMSVVVGFSKGGPSRQYLDEETYNAAWTSIRISGIVLGVVYYIITAWLYRKSR